MRSVLKEATIAKAKGTDTGAVLKKQEEGRVAAIRAESTMDFVRKIKLRDRAESNFYEQDLQKTIKDRNFCRRAYNPKGSFRNSFVDNGDGTVTDQTTGLMWQKGGCSPELSFCTAKKYVQDLNEKRFAGYNNSRLPTVEELSSLLAWSRNQNEQFIDKFFDGVQEACWTMDGHSRASSIRAFVVDFKNGDIFTESTESTSTYQRRHYVRAVRTIE